ncbi:MAG: hypothetical protein IKO27_08080 [Ruminococcus sp.]|nr:hypothetical protein [Ruminococcus sp.]
MGNVIRSDIYRLLRQKSFIICTAIVALLNLIIGPVGKLLYDISKRLAEGNDELMAELKEWSATFSVDKLIMNPLGNIDTIFVLLLIVWFAFGDLAHGYIKNVAGQLSNKGNIVFSKMAVIGIISLFMFIVAFAFQFLGLCLVQSPELSNIGESLVIFAVKWLSMLAIGSIILLITVGLHSQTAGAIFAVLFGTGLLRFAYSISINKLMNDVLKFEDFDVNQYMPDSILHTNDLTLQSKTLMIKAVIACIAFVCVLVPLTVSLFNKRDVK